MHIIEMVLENTKKATVTKSGSILDDKKRMQVGLEKIGKVHKKVFESFWIFIIWVVALASWCILVSKLAGLYVLNMLNLFL